MNTQSSEAAHYAALAQRVTGLEDGMKTIVSAVNGLADKLDRKGQTPWGTIASLAGVAVAILVAIGGLAYRPIDAAQARLDAELKVVQLQIVPRGEHERNWRVADRDLAKVEKRLDVLEEQEHRR